MISELLKIHSPVGLKEALFEGTLNALQWCQRAVWAVPATEHLL